MGERRKVRLNSKSYEDYLLNIVCTPKDKYKYSRMLHELYLTPYHSSIRLDQSRITDGLDMREAFLDECGFAGHRTFPVQCTVLEVLVAMCLRCERDIMCEPNRDKTARWFWDMMYFSNLADYPDNTFNREAVRDILDGILKHAYTRNGYGGFFYIPESNENMRKMDLWSQMMHYIDRELGDDVFEF